MKKVKLIALSGFLLTGCEGVPMPGELLNSGFSSITESAFGDTNKVMWPTEIDGKPLADLPQPVVASSSACYMLRSYAGTKAATKEIAQSIDYQIEHCRTDITNYEQAQVKEAQERDRAITRQRKAAQQEKIEAARIETETKRQQEQAQKERESMSARVPKGYSIDWNRNIAISIRNIRAGYLTFNDVKKKYQVGQGSGYRVSQVTGDWIIFEGYGDMPLIMEKPSGTDVLVGWDISQVGYFFEIMGTKEYPTLLGGSRQAILIEQRYLNAEK